MLTGENRKDRIDARLKGLGAEEHCKDLTLGTMRGPRVLHDRLSEAAHDCRIPFQTALKEATLDWLEKIAAEKQAADQSGVFALEPCEPPLAPVDQVLRSGAAPA